MLLQVTQAGQALSDTAMNVVGGEAGEISMSIWDLAMKGGWIMAILAVFSIIAVYIFIERYSAINRASKEDNNFMNHIRDFIYDGKIEAALAMCRKT